MVKKIFDKQKKIKIKINKDKYTNKQLRGRLLKMYQKT